MITDIFSSFDEQNLNFISFFLPIWTIGLIFIFFINFLYWWLPTRGLLFLGLFIGFIFQEVLRSFGKNLRGFSVLVPSLFFLLLMVNFLGLVPYVFGLTGHLVFTFSLGIPIWFSLLLSGLFFNSSVFFASFLPAGAPSILNPFLVVVETLSIMVRPVTLSVRLAANMGAGHIVIGLIGTYLSSGFFVYSLLALLVLLLVQISYFLFEFWVSLIQGYIFSLLVSLYADEHAH